MRRDDNQPGSVCNEKPATQAKASSRRDQRRFGRGTETDSGQSPRVDQLTPAALVGPTGLVGMKLHRLKPR